MIDDKVNSARHTHASFWERSQDIENRAIHYRLARFVRARIFKTSTLAAQLALEPRLWEARRNQWESDHYVRLLRWRESGFAPKVIYDIGAHEGRWSEMCQALFTPSQCCLFEPQTELLPIINQRNRGGGNWQIINAAVGDQNETATLHVTQNEAASSLLRPVTGTVPKEWQTNSVGAKEVRVTTLDTMVAERDLPLPDLIKIDVQGFEGKVLAGGQQTFARAQRMVVEVSLGKIYSGQAYLPEILNQATALGFELEDVNDAVRDHAGRLWQVDLWLKRAR